VEVGRNAGKAGRSRGRSRWIYLARVVEQALEDVVNPENQVKLRRKLAAATSAAIAKNGYVTAIDALIATG
jgi:hypothetical protein